AGILANRKVAVGAVLLALFVVVAAIGPTIAPYDPGKRGRDLLQPPSGRHWFGTTHLGQDIFSQVLVGTRSVLLVGFTAGLVETARASGESSWRIIGFEILPNLFAIIASSFVSTVMYAVMTEVALAFIGVPGLAEWNWGSILYWAQSNQALQQGAWWWFVPAG